MSKKQRFQAVWRKPGEQTLGFPKLQVDDDMVSGSINIRDTRLPLWAIITEAIMGGWESVEGNWGPEQEHGYRKEDLAHFLYCLLEQRGEFGRLCQTGARYPLREQADIARDDEVKER